MFILREMRNELTILHLDVRFSDVRYSNHDGLPAKMKRWSDGVAWSGHGLDDGIRGLDLSSKGDGLTKISVELIRERKER